MTEHPRPYATAADAYWRAGWRGILPLPAGAKWPPPKGYTGDSGAEPSYPDVHAWVSGNEGGGNIALRLPRGIIGLDVDAYGSKAGAETMRLAEAEHGPLPATWRTTSRDDGISGIRLYRVPEGLRWPTEIGPAVEVIRHGHRYAVAWPSVHPEGGTYRWINPHGVVSTAIPDPDLLPELPEAWVMGITGGEAATPTTKMNVAHQTAMAWLVDHDNATADMCARMTKGLEQYDEAVAKSTHDAVVKATLRIARLTDEGHHGVVHAIGEVRRRFMADATDPERALLGEHRRSESEAKAEFGRAVSSAVGVVLANPSAHPTCDCYGQITGMIATGPLTTDGATALAPSLDVDTTVAELTATDDQPEALRRMRDGASFILDAPEKVPSIWGDGDECLWAEGEALMIVGPPGVGKTTLTGQVVRGLLGLQDSVLGLSVRPSTGRVLYLAMDRPAQIARGLRRAFDEADRPILSERLRVWEGPPPGDIAKHTDVMLTLAELAEADVVIVDSVKDAAVGLTEDETAAAYNRARQKCLANGVQMLELHHMVKRGANGTKPTELADVYGSAWLTAGAGSVLLLWGAAGDLLVEMRHLKQPVGEVGPWQLMHDHANGTTSVTHGADLLTFIAAAGHVGRSTQEVAAEMFDVEKSDKKQDSKARRRLDALIAQGHLETYDRPRDGAAGGRPQAMFRAVSSNPGTQPRPTSQATSGAPNLDPTSPNLADDKTAGQSNLAQPRDNPAQGPTSHAPPSTEGGVRWSPVDTRQEDTSAGLVEVACNSCFKPTMKIAADKFDGRCSTCAREAGLL